MEIKELPIRVIQSKPTSRECINGKHKIRDNAFGVTWCVRCGRLFNKACGVKIKEYDKIIIKSK